jgi:biopolymer transport protein TolR
VAPRLSGNRGKFDLGQTFKINVTPLVGVMLLLLTVFMVVAPPPPPAVTMEMPPPFDGIDDRQGGIFINVEQNNALYIGARPTRLATLAADIGMIVQGPDRMKTFVMVRANRAVPYKDVVTVLSTLKQAGYTNVGLVMEDL